MSGFSSPWFSVFTSTLIEMLLSECSLSCNKRYRYCGSKWRENQLGPPNSHTNCRKEWEHCGKGKLGKMSSQKQTLTVLFYYYLSVCWICIGSLWGEDLGHAGLVRLDRLDGLLRVVRLFGVCHLRVNINVHVSVQHGPGSVWSCYFHLHQESFVLGFKLASRNCCWIFTLSSISSKVKRNVLFCTGR